MSFKLLVGLLAVSAVQEAPSSATFCERMAPKIDLIPVEKGRQGNLTGEWRRDMATLGMSLVGGTLGTSISVRPVGEVSYQEAMAFVDKACQRTRAGARCRFEGPARIMMGTRKGEVDMEAAAGERAEIEIRGTKVFCRDPRAFADG